MYPPNYNAEYISSEVVILLSFQNRRGAPSKLWGGECDGQY